MPWLALTSPTVIDSDFGTMRPVDDWRVHGPGYAVNESPADSRACARPMNPSGDRSTKSDLHELLSAVREHLDAGILLASQGLGEAERTANEAFEQFFHRCLQGLRRAQADASWLNGMPGRNPLGEQVPHEQVSEATFAPGDGADDTQLAPEEEAHGKPGNWPTD